jgi:hypothetical protein
MFGDYDEGAIARRCLDEALSVQDRLTPSQPRPTALARTRIRVVGAATGLRRRFRRGFAAGRAALRIDRPVAR